jgi:hypothetical protein
VLLILLLPAAFISFTQYQYHKRTGIVTYSPLIGWELLGTALTAYIKIPKEKRIHEDISYRLLEETNNRFIDSIQHSSTLPDITLRQYYIWNQNSPLYTFIGQKSDPLKSWAQFGKFYNEYALLLIKRYPGPYLQYFVLPNLRHYYTPKISLPAMYNTFLTGRRSHLYSWFQLKESDLTFHKSLDLLAGYYTILFSMLNLFFAFSMIVLGLSRKMHEEWNYLQKSFGLLIAILTSNFLFYVLTKPVEIGYQVAYMVTIFIFSTLAVQMVTKRSVKQEMIAINYDNK